MFCSIMFGLHEDWWSRQDRCLYQKWSLIGNKSACMGAQTHIHKPSLRSKWSYGFLAFPLQSQSPEHTPCWPHSNAYLLVDIIVGHYSCVWVSVCVWETGRNTTLGNPPLSLGGHFLSGHFSIVFLYLCSPLSIPVFPVSLSFSLRNTHIEKALRDLA